MERFTESELQHLVRYGELPKRTFWHSFFGNIIRWIVFLPGIYLSFFIALFLGAATWNWVAGWFDGEMKLSFGVLIAAIVIAIFFLQFAIFFIYSFFWAFWGIPYIFCAVVAPSPKLAAPIFGTTFTLLLIPTLFKNVVSWEWGWLVFNLVSSAFIYYGTAKAYQEGA